MKEFVFNNGSPYYSIYWSKGKADFDNKTKAEIFFNQINEKEV